MKNYSLIAVLALGLAVSACAPKATVTGTVADAPDSKLTIETLTTLGAEVLDTVKTDANGCFKYNFDVKEGEPEFVYVYRNGVKLTSLLLSAGDKVSFSADTLGSWSVEGSQDCALLKEVEADFAAFISRLTACKTTSEFAKTYVDYYRDRVKFLLGHTYSMVCVPVLYQHINESTPIFAQNQDALYFRRAADSLATVYPSSKYVKALDREATRRMQQMGIEEAISNAEATGIIDIKLPDINGEQVSLAGVQSKVTILHFWDVTSVSDKMMIQDELVPLYKNYHKKGLEIYSVGISYDKAQWAAIVKAQNLPWINVCDGRGAACSALTLYNVQKLPASILIVNGEVSDATISSTLSDSVKRILK